MLGWLCVLLTFVDMAALSCDNRFKPAPEMSVSTT
jgi:hypothetical protein